jgi:glycerol uptake facilitator protein
MLHPLREELLDESTFLQRFLSELLGTAFLIFIGVGSVPAMTAVNGSSQMTYSDLGIISLAFGTIVAATTYCLGHISGNHINPAVTFALAVARKFPWREVPGYVIAQLLGATIGGFAIVGALGSSSWKSGLGVASYHVGVGGGQAFIAESIGTFVLVFVIMGAIDRRAPMGWAGLAIGFTVFDVIIVIAPITSGAINPARLLGPMAVLDVMGGSVHWTQVPVYVSAELVGGAIAAVLYLAMVRARPDRVDGVSAF